METPATGEFTIEGVAASPGIAYGPAFVIERRELEIPTYQVEAGRRDEEVARFDRAVVATRQQLQQVQREVQERLGPEEASIFDAHLLVLDDNALIGEVVREMETSGQNVEAAFQRVAARYLAVFARMDDEFLRERAADVRDVTRRLLLNLLGESAESLGHQVAGRIVIASELAPSDSAGLERGKVAGVVADTGGRTGHAVIMARSMKVPAVVGTGDAAARVRTGDLVLLDGFEGLLIVRPEERTLFRYGRIQRAHRSVEALVQAEVRLPSVLLEGGAVAQRVNIEGTDDLWKLEGVAHDGVGLFRTEYLFLNAMRPPSEEEQYAAYRAVAEKAGRRPVVIRTLDIGGDKPLGRAGERLRPESNPFLGLRAIRFCLENPDIFRPQLRAILRASAHGQVWLMYPMISGPAELERANAVLEECRGELRREGVAFDETMPVGTMIEVPSAAATADLLARECSFFSIGTNDLIQYLLAVDRVNDAVGHLYDPMHPAVIRTIKQIVDAAHAAGIHVGVCGELAGDPVFAPILIGLGVDELSMAPGPFALIKYILRHLRRADAVELAGELLRLGRARDIRRVAESFHRDAFRELRFDERSAGPAAAGR